MGGGTYRGPGRSFRLETSSEESRWRRAQRYRLRHMTRRGRASVAAVVAAVLAGAVWIVALSGPAAAPPASDAARGVGAAPPENRTPSTPPREILERLPVSRRALDLRVFGATGDDLGSAAEAGVYGRLYETLPVAGSDGGWASPLRIE